MENIEVRRVAIFGAGVNGKLYHETLRQHGIEVAFFIDNMLPLPATFQGKPVYRPSHLFSENGYAIDAVFLASARYEEMRQQLNGLRYTKPIIEQLGWCSFEDSRITISRPPHYENFARCNRNIRENRTVIDNAPLLLIASVAHGCNLSCGICYLQGEHELAKGGARNHAEMSEQTFARVCELLPKVQDALITVEGEILLFKKWLRRWLKMLKEIPEMRISLQSNGMLLSENVIAELLESDRVVRIAILIDGASSRVNDAIRAGACLETILSNIGALIRAKQAQGKALPVLHCHFVMQRSNIHELPQLILRLAQMGVHSVSARHIIVQRREQIKDSLYFYQTLCDDFLDKAREIGEQCKVLVDLPIKFSDAVKTGCVRRPDCHEPWRHGQVLHDGKIYSCCNNAIVMGNINEGGFEHVWNNDKFQELRRTINTADLKFTMCRYCNALMPVNCFEAHVETKLLHNLVQTGELEQWCPGRVNLLMRKGEPFIG